MTPHAQRRTYRFVKAYVTRNVLSDSAPINVREISAALGVSLVPVREALFRVSHERLVDFVPERGFFAKRLSQSDVTHACLVSQAVAVAGLDDDFVARHEKQIAAVGAAAVRCGRELSEGTKPAHAFWWTEAVIRRLVEVCYHRQPRWHLLSILDQTLAFRRAVSNDAHAAAELAKMLGQLTEQISTHRLDLATATIRDIVEHEAGRFEAGYYLYADALTHARRRQNGSLGAIEGLLVNRSWSKESLDVGWSTSSY
ncbi:GntR family transcriptional regulator [Neorhizobium sp. DT-125]|uniref:GntR family transcriptional regulator n=1 Tax=Neorhizobium sp. DT-125 TaxID=3396163 RepID=UPI003F1CFB58